MRCDFCGREWIFVWPELWPYRYEGKVFCSENCKICDSTLIKLGRGKKKPMSRMKKDGTPARKPGPKAQKRIETPEGEIVTTITKEPPKPLDGGEWERMETPETNKVEVVETPERQIGGLCPPPEVEDDRLFHTAAVRNKKLGTFYYDDKHGTIDWRHPYGEEISLFPEDYRLLRDSIDTILHVLGV